MNLDSLYVPATLNYSPVGRGERGRIKKKKGANPMMITYPELLEAMQQQLELSHTRQIFSNLKSALNQYLADIGVSPDGVVGVELRTSIYKRVAEHLANMRQAGRSEQVIRDRKSLLKKWRTLLISMEKARAAETRATSPFANAIREATPQGMPLDLLAKQACVSLSSLKRWRAGVLPSRRSLPAIQRLERFLALPPGHFSDFLEPADAAGKKSALKPIAYRERLKAQAKSPYRLKVIPERVRAQWADLLAYKSALLPLAYLRSVRGRWSASTLPVSQQQAKKWFAINGDGSHVPAAEMNWTLVSAYFGWLTKHNGFNAEDLTLAHLTDLALLERYLQWYLQRAGGKANGGHVRFCQFVLSLVNPVTGYLTQHKELRLTLSSCPSENQWSEFCLSVFQKLTGHKKALARAERRSRDPNEPIAPVLQLENPMLALLDMQTRLRVARPTTGTKTEAVWGRDVLLIGLLLCTPLRAGNLRHLTYRPDNSGNLRRTPDGRWELHIPGEHFKNRHGAASDGEYAIELDRCIHRDIEAYLEVFRPMLLGDPNATNLLFVSSKKATSLEPWQSLNRHVEALTAKYLMMCPGVGPHAIRHIIATAIVKTSGQYSTAALVLHDREETIRKNYSHLVSQDGHVRFRKMFPEIFRS